MCMVSEAYSSMNYALASNSLWLQFKHKVGSKEKAVKKLTDKVGLCLSAVMFVFSIEGNGKILKDFQEGSINRFGLYKDCSGSKVENV